MKRASLLWNFEWRLAALKNGFQDALAYRIEFLFEVLGYMFVPAAVQLVLWYALFKVGGATDIAGYTYKEMIAYTFASVLFSQIRGGNHDFELMEMIRTGQLSQYILRPVSVVEFVYIRGISAKLLIAGCCLMVGLLLSPVLGMAPHRLLGAMLLALVGNVIHYLIGASIATVAFAWEEAYSILMVKNMIVDLLCGELIPLFLFPPHLEWVWKYTPFYLYVFGPAQYSLGKWSHQEFLHHLTIAMVWLVAMAVLTRLSWRWGIKRYSSLGG
jgi:ABC-2 type transport system permease protein